jgi:HPt (histidine-containing phosphotransfer) domain-containing protein
MGHSPATHPAAGQTATRNADPELDELVRLYLDRLPANARELAALLEAHDLEGIRRLAHQLRGCSAGFGFHEVGAAAGALEDGLRHDQDPSDRLLAQAARGVRRLVETLALAARPQP